MIWIVCVEPSRDSINAQVCQCISSSYCATSGCIALNPCCGSSSFVGDPYFRKVYWKTSSIDNSDVQFIVDHCYTIYLKLFFCNICSLLISCQDRLIVII